MESRRLLSTTLLDAHGNIEGRLEAWTPPGGLHLVHSTRPRPAGDDVDPFHIELVFKSELTAAQQAAFETAAARWEQIITGGLPDVGAAPDQYGDAVDDVRIDATSSNIDGLGGVLAQAGPEYIRGETDLPINGHMTFDAADLANLESNGQLVSVITHEMGHVLGLGTIWDLKGLLTGTGTVDSAYTGMAALLEYRAFVADPSAPNIPIETNGGQGTADEHWRETVFENELMTGFFNGPVNPLSRMTAAQFIDLGYPTVNVDAADLYTVTNPLPTVGTLTASPAAGPAGTPFSLTLSSATDDTSVASVSFYAESNGVTGLQATTIGGEVPDTIISTDVGSPYQTNVNPGPPTPGTYTYYARAVDSFGLFSAVASTSFTVADAPPTPSAPDLVSASDSGASATDNCTNDNTPTFTGNTVANATVQLLIDGNATPIATAIASGSGVYTLTPASPIADGTHTVSVVAIANNVASARSATLAVTIDTRAPTILAAFFRRSPGQLVEIEFNEPITPDAAGTATLTRDASSPAPPLTFSAPGSPLDEDTIDYAVPGNALADGHYQVSLGGVADLAGNVVTDGTPVLSFGFLAADFDGNLTVDFNDLLVLARNYGQSPRTHAEGDANYDGVVNFDDLLLLARSYQTSVAPAAADLLAGATRRRRT